MSINSPDVFEQSKKIDNGKCQVWGCSCREGLESHHIIPRSQGGPDELWNLITLCHYHHRLVTNKKLLDIDLLQKIKRRRNFRWQPALAWHIEKEEIRKYKRGLFDV